MVFAKGSDQRLIVNSIEQSCCSGRQNTLGVHVEVRKAEEPAESGGYQRQSGCHSINNGRKWCS